MPLVVRNVTFSSVDPERLAEFWSAATGFTERRVSADGIMLAPDDWGFPRFLFQHLAEPSAPSGRLHLDLTAGEMRAEVRRLIELGATELWTVDVARSGTTNWTAMRDPDGNEFCVVQRPTDE